MSAPALEADFSLAVGESAGGFQLEASLALERGVLVLFGPSGSGKSLTIQALAGLLRPTTGTIRVAGRLLHDAATRVHVPPHRRRVGYVPQHHSLFPFRDVTENVVFGLPRALRRRNHPRVQALMAELGLVHLARARPEDLSGGERQRVALARALAVEPDLLLLDEPFAAIDVDGRQSLRDALRAALAEHGTPAVFVTHDRNEVRALADRVVRFERGRTVGSFAPGDVMSPRLVRVRGTAAPGAVVREGERAVLRLDGAEIEAPAALLQDLQGEIDIELRAPGRRMKELDDA